MKMTILSLMRLWSPYWRKTVPTGNVVCSGTKLRMFSLTITAILIIIPINITITTTMLLFFILLLFTLIILLLIIITTWGRPL